MRTVTTKFPFWPVALIACVYTVVPTGSHARLSWPGRYSHSPGEVLDLRDLTNLGRLIVAVAGAGE